MIKWKTASLGDLCDVTTGGTPLRSSTHYFGGNIPWVKIGDMLQGTVTKTEETITEDALAGSAAKLLSKGTVLISIFATIGRTAVLGVEAATNQAIAGVTPRDLQALRPDYLRRFLDSVVPTLEGRARGVAQVNINSGILRSLAVPLPPLPEQRRIAEILDKADALRATRRAAVAQLDTLTQSVFFDMFGDPVENSRQFATRPMMELIDEARPISYGILMPGPDQPEGIKYVRVVDMQDGGIALSGIRKTTEAISNTFRRSLLKTGDLLMSIRGHVGRFAVVPPELDGANITQDTARLAIVGADPVFVRECLRTDGFQRWMAKHTKGVAVQGINLTDVKLMPIILPPLDEQKRFARFATATSQLRAAARVAHGELDALFASLQHRAFRGEL